VVLTCSQKRKLNIILFNLSKPEIQVSSLEEEEEEEEEEEGGGGGGGGGGEEEC
jgi:hypothetical protein